MRYPNPMTFKMRPEVCILSASLQRRCARKSKRAILEEVYPELCVLLEMMDGQSACLEDDKTLFLARLPQFK